MDSIDMLWFTVHAIQQININTEASYRMRPQEDGEKIMVEVLGTIGHKHLSQICNY